MNKTYFVYINELTEMVKLLAQGIKYEVNIDRYKQYREIYEGIGMILSLLRKIEGLDQSIVDAQEEGALKSIEQITEAYKNNDNIMIADILEYELLPLLTEWKDIISQLED